MHRAVHFHVALTEIRATCPFSQSRCHNFPNAGLHNAVILFHKKYIKLMEKKFDYVAPQCVEVELLLDGVVLQNSILDFGDGGEL